MSDTEFAKRRVNLYLVDFPSHAHHRDDLIQEATIASWRARCDFREGSGASVETLRHRYVATALDRFMRPIYKHPYLPSARDSDRDQNEEVTPMELQLTCNPWPAIDARIDLEREVSRLAKLKASKSKNGGVPPLAVYLTVLQHGEYTSAAKVLGITKQRVYQVLTAYKAKTGRDTGVSA